MNPEIDEPKKSRLAIALVICGIVFAVQFSASATSFTISNTVADAFLSGAAPTLNFGSAGTLAIAPASSPKGEFDSVIMFDTASAVSQFNTTYGPGNWTITGVQLSLASNFGTAGVQPNNPLLPVIHGGGFGIDWLANNSWVEGTGGAMGGPGYPTNNSVSFDSISSLFAPGFDSLGTNTYAPPGNNVYVNYSLPLDANLVAGARSGGAVSLYFYAADSQIGYLFNSREFTSNHPELTLTAAPVPEPGALAMVASALSGCFVARRRRNRG